MHIKITLKVVELPSFSSSSIGMISTFAGGGNIFLTSPSMWPCTRLRSWKKYENSFPKMQSNQIYLIVNQTITNDSGKFITPNSNELFGQLEQFRIDQQHSGTNSRQIFQIENVMKFGWSRWQFYDNNLYGGKHMCRTLTMALQIWKYLEQFQCNGNQSVCNVSDFWIVFIDVAPKNGTVNMLNSAVVRKMYVEHSKLGNESRIDFITTTTSHTHSSKVFQICKDHPFQTFVAAEHSASFEQQFQQSNRLLRSISETETNFRKKNSISWRNTNVRVHNGHIHVVDENRQLFTNRRTKYIFRSLFHWSFDGPLNIQWWCTGWEIQI